MHAREVHRGLPNAVRQLAAAAAGPGADLALCVWPEADR